MSPYPLHHVGMFRPDHFPSLNESKKSTSPVSESEPMYVNSIVVTGSSWDGLPPEKIRALKAQGHAWQRAAQKRYTEELAAAAAAPGGYDPNEPEPGATTNDVRVYTKLKNGEYKYWGIRDDDMEIEDFWAKFDPDNTRYEDDNEENPMDPVPAQITSSTNNPSPRASVSPRPTRSQNTPQINAKHRVRKSATVTPQASKRTRKSLATKVSAGLAGLDKQVPEIQKTTSRSRRSAAHLATVERSDAHAKGPKESDAATSTPTQALGKAKGRGRPRNVQSGVPDSTNLNADVVTPSPAKRKPGRPAQTKPASKISAKQDRPAAESNAKITKPKQRTQRTLAPSIHAMRTRAKGSANLSHLL